VVRVFLALVAYVLISVLYQTSKIASQLPNVNILDEIIEGSILRNAVPLPSVRSPQLPSVIVRDDNMTGGFMRRNSVPTILPLRVFREWQYHHSVEAIKRNPHNRTFIVGGYSCPRQAGNIFHEYSSALLQAVATNRTFLWEHRRSEYWESMGENSEEACDRILQRASWIPSYSELNHTLQLDPPFEMLHNGSRADNADMWQRLDRGERIADDLSEYQVILSAERMWGISKKPEVWEGLLLLTNNYTAKYISQFYGIDLIHNEIVQALYSQGASFLYGMLFRESFGFTNQFLETVSEDWYQSGNSTAAHRTDPSVYTIGLHSRHILSAIDGSNVQNEIKCLDCLLGTRENENVPCTVYIMSDRPNTIENLRAHLLQRNCSVVVAAHIMDSEVNHTAGSETEEHGPFAGAGFFRDLLVVSQARSAFIGRTRSSSALVDELIEYDGHINAWAIEDELLDRLHRCDIGNPNRSKPTRRKLTPSKHLEPN
jgi:hypothetical protein